MNNFPLHKTLAELIEDMENFRTLPAFELIKKYENFDNPLGYSLYEYYYIRLAGLKEVIRYKEKSLGIKEENYYE